MQNKLIKKSTFAMNEINNPARKTENNFNKMLKFNREVQFLENQNTKLNFYNFNSQNEWKTRNQNQINSQFQWSESNKPKNRLKRSYKSFVEKVKQF